MTQPTHQTKQPAVQAKPPAAKTHEVAPIDDFWKALTKMEDQFKAALPPQIDVSKFLRVARTAVQVDPNLLKANRMTLYSACMKAAQDGLLVDKREAALVIFGEEVVYMPMVQGILKKIRNSGELSNIMSELVFKNDKFKYWVDDKGAHLEHEPLIFGDRGDLLGVYAQATTKDGASYIEVMTDKQLNDVKNVSRSKDKGPWAGPFADEMRRKSVIRRLSKRLPMSTDLEAVIHRDDDLYNLDKADEPEKAKTSSSRLNKIIEAQTEPQKHEVAPTEEPPAETAEVSEAIEDEHVPI